MVSYFAIKLIPHSERKSYTMIKYLKLPLLILPILLISHPSYANMPSGSLNRKMLDNVASFKLGDLPLASNPSYNTFWLNDHQETDCLIAAINQQSMNQCLQRQAQYSNQQLNQLLTEMQQIFGNNAEQWLQFNQLNHKWKLLREQICLLEKATFGVGLVAPMIYHNCITFYNSQYLETLKNLLYTAYQNQSDWNQPD